MVVTRRSAWLPVRSFDGSGRNGNKPNYLKTNPPKEASVFEEGIQGFGL